MFCWPLFVLLITWQIVAQPHLLFYLFSFSVSLNCWFVSLCEHSGFYLFLLTITYSLHLSLFSTHLRFWQKLFFNKTPETIINSHGCFWCNYASSHTRPHTHAHTHKHTHTHTHTSTNLPSLSRSLLRTLNTTHPCSYRQIEKKYPRCTND